MGAATHLQTFFFQDTSCTIYVPANTDAAGVNSPYWQQVWPAAIGLCQFIRKEPHWVEHKRVLELAAGLGLPGVFIARYAKEVIISDIEPGAMDIVNESVRENGLTNVTTAVLDWRDYRNTLLPDLLLLSDVNYAPASFDGLKEAMDYYLYNGVTIVLATPQRLMAKPFIMALLADVIQQVEEQAIIGGEQVAISVFVIRRKS